jgi:hypothetical protein
MSVARTRRGLYIPAMPELAEVEFYRKQWQCGLRQKILAVELHPHARLLRGADTEALREDLDGGGSAEFGSARQTNVFPVFQERLAGPAFGHDGQAARGTARPRGGPARSSGAAPAEQSLVFTDPRQFGRVRFHAGDTHASVAGQSARPDLVKPIYAERDGTVSPAAWAHGAQGGVAHAGRFPRRRQLDGG